MKLCFSTLGCPDWSWSRVVEAAPRMGYDGLEIRGIQGEMYLPKAEPFLPHNIGNTMADLAKRGLSIACLGASSHFHGPNVDENVKEAKAYVDLAVRLRVRYVRVFGDKIPDPAKKEQTLQRVAASLRELGEYAAPQGVRILIETHGDFSRSQDLLDVLERVGDFSSKFARQSVTYIIFGQQHMCQLGVVDGLVVAQPKQLRGREPFQSRVRGELDQLPFSHHRRNLAAFGRSPHIAPQQRWTDDVALLI
jgi:hypothetical protein